MHPALTRAARHLAFIVSAAVAVGGCVRPYVRDTRDPRLAMSAPCRSGESCPEDAGGDDGGFLWTLEVMESAR